MCRAISILFSSDSLAVNKVLPSPRQMGPGSATTICAPQKRGMGRSIVSLAAILLFTACAFGQSTFGPQAVGTAATPQVVPVTVQAAGTVATVQVVTQGNQNLDFTAGAGTCASATLAVNQQCNQTVNFTPAFPGQRMGAVVLLDSSSRVLGTTYLQGTGLGGLPVLLPGNEVPYVGIYWEWQVVNDGQLAKAADLNLPSSVALDAAGNMYIADSLHNRIRKVDAATHVISTVAGNGNSGVVGDGGLAVNASLSAPSGVALDGAGNLYIADTGNNVIRQVATTNGMISTIAGTGVAGFTGDGNSATNATLNQPWGVTVDGAGNLFIADTFNHAIRKVNAATGIITTVAGTGYTTSTGEGDYSGDGRPAVQARLNFPYAVAFDAASNMYIPDSNNNRVRKVDASGIMSTLAGIGKNGALGDGGPASSAELWVPSGVAVDPAGNVYIADSQNNAIRKVNAATGNISTLITAASGQSYVAPNFVANVLYGPKGLALDGFGNLFVADYYDMQIQEIQPNVLGVNFVQTPTRQGSVSTPKKELLENDGNAALQVVKPTPDSNSALDTATTTCAAGTSIAPDASCALGVEFAPSIAGNPLTANIAITSLSVDSPVNVILVGNAPKVNDTTTKLTANPTPSKFGQTVALSAIVTTGPNTGALTGTVTFYDGAITLQSNVNVNGNGVATINVTGLGVGIHSLTAVYVPDVAHFGSTSAAFVQMVNEATATAVGSSANPAALGSPVTFTATVSIPNGGGVVPTGTVTFMDGSIALATVPLTSSGTAAYTTSTLIDGSHAITAVFSGNLDTYVLGSTSGALNQSVLAASSVVVASNTNPSIYGSPVTFTATVSSTASLAPSGIVNFLDGSKQIGSATIAGTAGVATFVTSALSAGNHAITAAYKGNPNSGPGTSAPIVQVVNLTHTTTAITASPIPGIAGAPVTLTASVAVVAGSATVTGTVTFTDGSAKLGTAAVGANGKATINPILAPGAHAIAAAYGGDVNDEASTSTALPVNVILATTTVALKTGGSPAFVLSGITFTATVTGNGGTPTGTIMFAVDGINASSVTVSPAGTASFTDSGLAVGNHTVVATYSGDTNDNPSTSGGVAEVVQAIPTVTHLGTTASPGPQSQAILVATAIGTAGPTPTGTITFTYSDGTKTIGSSTLDSNGVATVVPDLPPGKYSVVASYSGDALHSPSTSSPVSFAGTPIEFGVAVNPAAITMASSQNGTVTVNVTSSNNFADSIGMGCLSLPAAVNCHFSANTVVLKAGESKAVELTIDTNAPLTGGQTAGNASYPGGMSLAALGGPASLFLGFVLWRFRKRNAVALVAILALFLAGTVALTGCGASFSQHTVAPGTYVIQVGGIGTGSNISHYQNVTLTITK